MRFLCGYFFLNHIIIHRRLIKILDFSSGSHEAFILYSPGTNRASNVPVLVTSGSSSNVVFVNQELAPVGSIIDSDQTFHSLSFHQLSATSGAAIKIDTAGTNEFVIVDAAVLQKTCGT